jgi:hypothetical protein
MDEIEKGRVVRLAVEEAGVFAQACRRDECYIYGQNSGSIKFIIHHPGQFPSPCRKRVGGSGNWGVCVGGGMVPRNTQQI